MTLRSIPFADLYLGESTCWFSGVVGEQDPMPAPQHCLDELGVLREACESMYASKERPEFFIRVDEISYRASILESMRERVFVLRRFPDAVPLLSDLGLHPQYVKHLMTPGLHGLVMVAGAFGQGKTTTASALVAARASKFGGVAVCIEDPPEMPLEGRHGAGVCYQRSVDRGGFAQECRAVARWAPTIIFVGEVRDKETATEVLKASTSGRLVVCTIHSMNARTAVERIFTYATGGTGNGEDVSTLLSSGLTGVLHQKLEGEVTKRPVVEMLWLDSTAAVGARSLIRQRKWQSLDDEVTLQRNQLLMKMQVT